MSLTKEKNINEALAAMPPDKRPEARMRGQRIQFVATTAKGCFEATTTNGHAEIYTAAECFAWVAPRLSTHVISHTTEPANMASL